jgi:hypothetical protein
VAQKDSDVAVPRIAAPAGESAAHPLQGMPSNPCTAVAQANSPPKARRQTARD